MTKEAGNVLEGYAKLLGDAFERADSPVFMLNQPHTATMKTRLGKYIREPLIGSEEFTAVSAYMGKRGKIIIMFKPRDIHVASKYSFMEMDAETARVAMTGFAAYMDSKLDVDFNEQLRRINEEEGREVREAHFRQKANQYAESFGSW